MWKTRETEEFARRLKQFAKKYRRETLAMLNNLDTYLKTLQAGVHPQQFDMALPTPKHMGR